MRMKDFSKRTRKRLLDRKKNIYLTHGIHCRLEKRRELKIHIQKPY